MPARANLRAFISYSSTERVVGARVKAVLKMCGIDGFLAHEDIPISVSWKDKLLVELKSCDIYLPLLSKAFRASDYAQQEIGVLAGRSNFADVTVLPLSIDDTPPFGLIAHLQGKRLPIDGDFEGRLLGLLQATFPELKQPRSTVSLSGSLAIPRQALPEHALLSSSRDPAYSLNLVHSYSQVMDIEGGANNNLLDWPILRDLRSGIKSEVYIDDATFIECS